MILTSPDLIHLIFSRNRINLEGPETTEGHNFFGACEWSQSDPDPAILKTRPRSRELSGDKTLQALERLHHVTLGPRGGQVAQEHAEPIV